MGVEVEDNQQEYSSIEWMWNHVLDTRDMLGMQSTYTPEFLAAMKAFYFLGAFGYAVCQKELTAASIKKGLSMADASVLIKNLFNETQRLSAESILGLDKCESSTTSQSP